MSEKIVGYLLLFSGVGIILFSLFNVYQVFTKQRKPVQFFNFPAISLDLNQAANIKLPQDLIDAGVEIEQKQSKKQEILPASVLNDSSNILAHIIFLGFVVNVGFKIALIGAEIVRPVVVKTSKYSVAGKTITKQSTSQSTLDAKPQKG